jgi:very-short-patch-repair endonuclease
MTDAETKLWQSLRREQLGVKFRKQHPMPPFILDFYCVEKKLAIELDGGQHNEAEAIAYDARRSEWLKAQGITVLRFWNNDVLSNLEGVLAVVVDGLRNPPPQPSPAGGGGLNESPPAVGGSFIHESETNKTMTKLSIFHYVYAVLHDPIYREKYALNLKREFPRIPFYADFWQWASWGEALMQAHIGYESAEPFALTRKDLPSPQPSPTGRGGKVVPKAKLKADKTKGEIVIDEATTLSGIPACAWDYKLGNRSALEWVLDQYKESKPKDPTIREKFNTYQFADYKEQVIDLLAKVCTVSMQTQAIVEAMRNLAR